METSCVDVIKSRKTFSGSEVAAITHAMRFFYTEYGEYLVLCSDFRAAGGTLSQPAVVAVLRYGFTVGDVGLVT